MPRLKHAVASGQEGPYRGESCPGPPHRIPCRACGAPWFLRWGYSRLIPCRVVLLALMRPTQSSSGCRSGPRRRPSPRLQRLVGRRPPRLPQRFASSPRCWARHPGPNRRPLQCGQRRAGSFWRNAWLRRCTCSGARQCGSQKLRAVRGGPFLRSLHQQNRRLPPSHLQPIDSPRRLTEAAQR